MVQRDLQREGKRFQEQQQERSGVETAMDYTLRHFCVTHPNIFQSIVEEGEPRLGGI